MNNINFGLYIVIYNLIIGILLMLASEKIGSYAGYFTGSYRTKISRLTRIGVLTFGSCVVVVCMIPLVAGYILHL